VSQASRDEELLGDEPFLVLNAIYLRKMASPEHVALVTGLDAGRARTALGIAQAEGLTVDLGGQAMLSDAGRERVLAYYRETYAGVRSGATLGAWYDRFETLNGQFIKLVTEWQKSDGDERVQERLVRLVERQISSLRELAKIVPRYENYAVRFERGLSKIDSGGRDYVCKPTLDSVHNVWFEFHEDILALMGKPRET
jgi:hypothetical protein